MLQENKPDPIHPTIRKCLKHIDILGADDKMKQIVYMYMATLHQEMTLGYEVVSEDITEESALVKSQV